MGTAAEWILRQVNRDDHLTPDVGDLYREYALGAAGDATPPVAEGQLLLLRPVIDTWNTQSEKLKSHTRCDLVLA